MDQSGLSFYSVQFCLRYQPYYAEKSYIRPEGEINHKDFLYYDIYEKGIVERVERCVQEIKNYYNRGISK